MDRRYIIAGLFFAAAAIVVITLVYPTYQVLTLSSVLVEEKEKEFGAQNLLVQELTRLKTQYNQAEQGVVKVSSLLPVFHKKSIPELFIVLEGVASLNGVLLETVSFGQINNKSDSGTELGYQKINVDISLKGDYKSFKNFTRAIELSEHLMDIKQIAFSSVQVSNEQGTGGGEESSREGGGEEIPEIRETENLYTYKVSLDVYYQ